MLTKPLEGLQEGFLSLVSRDDSQNTYVVPDAFTRTTASRRHWRDYNPGVEQPLLPLWMAPQQAAMESGCHLPFRYHTQEAGGWTPEVEKLDNSMALLLQRTCIYLLDFI